mmetsp:Transcript_4751/g.17810  ORF Transcript_4751/g.17810 Transcript_4751/m.17810 type:complete len:236 (-) Transcript_4751:487-1194(-)
MLTVLVQLSHLHPFLPMIHGQQSNNTSGICSVQKVVLVKSYPSQVSIRGKRKIALAEDTSILRIDEGVLSDSIWIVEYVGQKVLFASHRHDFPLHIQSGKLSTRSREQTNRVCLKVSSTIVWKSLSGGNSNSVSIVVQSHYINNFLIWEGVLPFGVILNGSKVNSGWIHQIVLIGQNVRLLGKICQVEFCAISKTVASFVPIVEFNLQKVRILSWNRSELNVSNCIVAEETFSVG